MFIESKVTIKVAQPNVWVEQGLASVEGKTGTVIDLRPRSFNTYEYMGTAYLVRFDTPTESDNWWYHGTTDHWFDKSDLVSVGAARA